MSTIVTRAGKGSPLENSELDLNFTNLNTDKLEINAALGTPASVTLTNATGLPTAGLVDNAVTDAKLRDSAGLSVIGRGANSTGDPADIVAGTNHQVLRRDGSSLGFGAVDLSSNQAVTGTLPVNQGGTGLTSYTANGVVYASGTGTLASGTGLTFDGSTLNVTRPSTEGLVFELDSAGASTRTLEISSFTNSVAGAGWRFNASSSAGVLAFSTNSTERLRITSAGNVGIGTSSPHTKTVIALTPTVAATTVNETANFANQFVLGNAVTSNTGDRLPLVFNLSSTTANGISAAIVGEREAIGWNTALSFWTNSITSGPEGTDAIQEKMRITSAGNVGIGTTSPVGRLDVTATGDAAISLTIAGVQRYQFIAKLGGNFELFDQSASAARLTLKQSGNVGIGTTTPDANLTVNGAASFAAGTALLPSIARAGDLNTGIWFPAADTVAVSTAGSERLRIDSNGLTLATTTSSVRNITIGGNGASISLAGTNGGIYFGATGSPTGSGGFGANSAIARAGGNDFHLLGSIAGDLCIAVEGTKKIIFGTSASSGSAEIRASITSDGYLRMASGSGGIQFNGDTAAANALDDYEEGVWTPAIGTSTASVTYAAEGQLGTYTKIGRAVNFTAQINLATVTSNGSGTFIISGLPFASGAGAPRWLIQTNDVDIDATAFDMLAYPPGGGTTIQVLFSYDDSAWVAATVSTFVLSSTSIITVSGTYYTA